MQLSTSDLQPTCSDLSKICQDAETAVKRNGRWDKASPPTRISLQPGMETVKQVSNYVQAAA